MAPPARLAGLFLVRGFPLSLQRRIGDVRLTREACRIHPRLPLDQLKIDRAFVSRLPGGGGAMVAQTSIAMGRGLGMKVVAEGVETEARWAFLMERD
ncbi:EAL domain-containing protein [Dyella lutea]|uniref:EAL domain-containing protein n=1 Tax=Dyella lutea TaxID=2950441 RepID=A0ABT1FAD0_9GAMM|nr:EAL domain-containing protein [Dyella lutea]MCP1374331.1 EAL domain-containing protein [Dyella lutea]